MNNEYPVMFFLFFDRALIINIIYFFSNQKDYDLNTSRTLKKKKTF